MYWTGTRFWGGLSASDSAPYPRTQRFSSFEMLDDMLRVVTTNANLFPNLREIVVSGHSGGGQFVNRYAATSPFENTMLPAARQISMYYVVMNPSSYLYFDNKRHNPATLDLAGGAVNFIVPNPPVSGYDYYGYGLAALSGYQAAVGSNAILAQYPGRKIIYLTGTADTGTNSLDMSEAAMLQGTNRYERSRIYYHVFQ